MKNINFWLLKRSGSAIVILSANTENHFNNCVRGGDPEWWGWFGERLHFFYFILITRPWLPWVSLMWLKQELCTDQVRSYLLSSTLLRYYSITVEIRFGPFWLWECVSRWAVVAAMRYHQSGSANGESTLAFLACLVTCLIRAHYDFVLYCFIWSALWSTSSLRRNYGTVYTMGIYKRCKGNNGNPAYIILLCYI